MNKTTFSKSLIKFDNSSALPTEKEQGESPAFFDGTLGSEPKAASSRQEKSRAKVLLFLMARWGLSQRPPHPD